MPNDNRFEQQYGVFINPAMVMVPKAMAPPMDEAGWASAVNSDLGIVAGTKVGSLLLRAIRFHGKSIRISPYLAMPNVNACAANTRDAEVEDVGFGAAIQFTPGFYGAATNCVAAQVKIGGYAVQSNEVLLHELVHAFRKVSNKLRDDFKANRLKGGLAFYDNREEFAAVLVQGIYASERRRPIRSSHFKHFEIDKELAGSFEFFKSSEDTYQEVKRFCDENPGFTKALAGIRVPFNPIRAFYFAPARAKADSGTRTAHRRDAAMPLEKAIIEFLRDWMHGGRI